MNEDAKKLADKVMSLSASDLYKSIYAYQKKYDDALEKEIINAGQNIMNSIKEALIEIIELYKDDYEERWRDILLSDISRQDGDLLDMITNEEINKAILKYFNLILENDND